MSTPRSETRQQRLSTYEQTPGSVFGIRRRTRTDEELGSVSRVLYTVRPERLYFNVHDSDVGIEDDYDGLEGMCRKCSKIVFVLKCHVMSTKFKNVPLLHPQIWDVTALWFCG
jgi:hypothetical protein